MVYKTKGVCSRFINVELDGNIISSVEFVGGCSGNTQGVAALVKGMDVHEAIRRIEGVADARQYTVPVESAVEAARSGSNPELTTRQKHTRVCYVVLKEGADAAKIEREIVTMPNYFADYDTTVHFISAEEMARDHSGLPHGGFVIRTGVTGENGCHTQRIEYSLKLDSNPEFTASVLVAYARAAAKLARENQTGARTVLDIPPAYLSPLDGAQLRRTLL